MAFVGPVAPASSRTSLSFSPACRPGDSRKELRHGLDRPAFFSTNAIPSSSSSFFGNSRPVNFGISKLPENGVFSVMSTITESRPSETTDTFAKGKKPRIVVLGTGWAALPFVKGIDDNIYDIVMVSPRNYFLFTPLLCGTCVGTLESRSIIEPIRAYKQKVNYYEAACTGIDISQKVIYCTNDREQYCFALDYDKLVIAVGATSSTFGVPGVEQYTCFLKEISHAQKIRQRIIECFESASFPDITEEDRKRILSFVIVGGGPTGVEFAAELYDFCNEDVRRLFPSLVKDVKITLLQSGKRLLTQFDDTLGDYALENFKRQGIDVRTGSAVIEVTEREVVLKDGTEIPYGLCVWSAGNGPRQIVRQLMQDIGKKLKGEGMLGKIAVAASGGRAEGSRLLVDEFMKVKGVDDIYAIGDCASIENNPLPPTAQVAQQGGNYLASSLNKIARGVDREKIRPFVYRHLGTLAYVGSNKALADRPLDLPIKLQGFFTWLFWRSAYLSKLFSMKSRFLVTLDWVRAGMFGRDVSAILSDAYNVQSTPRKFGFLQGLTQPDNIQ